LFISKTAKISVKRLRFNSQWDARKQWKNKLTGTLVVDKGATFTAEDFTCYAGCRINGSLFIFKTSGRMVFAIRPDLLNTLL